MVAIIVDSTGVQTPSLPDAYAEMLSRYAEVFGVDLSSAPQTPQSQLAAIQAVITAEFGEALTAAMSAMSLDRASGTQLDDLGSLLGATRRSATRSRVSATLFGVAATNVPAGSRARTAGDAEFRTVADTVLSPTGVASEMEAVDEGPVVAATGALTEIVTVVAGWERVTNAAAATEGTDDESDNDYRLNLFVRSARNSLGPRGALEAALLEADTTRFRVAENALSAADVVQLLTMQSHSVFVIAEGGTDADLTRAVETHKGMGAGTMTTIIGGTPDNTVLDSVTDGTVTWDGTDYTDLDLSSASTDAAKATAVTTLLDGTGVTIHAIDSIYLATFPWRPDQSPTFSDGTVDVAFGLESANATYPAGPFTRPRSLALAVTVAVTRQADRFPGDGLAQIRDAINAVIAGYGIGEQLWSNDILAAIEDIAGTRVTALTVQANSADVSGEDVPLDRVWALSAANLVITVS